MNPVPLFVVQFLWFLAAWAVLGVQFALPALRHRARADAVALCSAPQMFRVLGLGLLVPNLAPGLPRAFALPTAVGDGVTAGLALAAVVALRRRWRAGWALAWACHVVGVADLCLALPHAAAIGAAQFLTAQWYVPALVVPLMIVSHGIAVVLLLERRQEPAGT